MAQQHRSSKSMLLGSKSPGSTGRGLAVHLSASITAWLPRPSRSRSVDVAENYVTRKSMTYKDFHRAKLLMLTYCVRGRLFSSPYLRLCPRFLGLGLGLSPATPPPHRVYTLDKPPGYRPAPRQIQRYKNMGKSYLKCFLRSVRNA